MNVNSMAAFVFPGQTSQKVGMFEELEQKYSIIGKLFSVASEVLDYDLWQVVQEGPEEKLNQTEFTQPALLVCDVAAWKICQLECALPEIAYFAGHSLGEYSALVCADAIDFEDAVYLVSERSKLMQKAVPGGEGGMAAIIGLDPAQIEAVCREAAQDDVVDPANFNSIGQTVIAGHLHALQRAITIAKKQGAKIAKVLPISIPSHCKLMQSAAEELAALLAKTLIKTPEIPVIQNIDVAYHMEPEKIRDALVRQLFSPVRWVETIEFFAQNGVNLFVECGPNNVLSGLNKRINKSIQTISFEQLLVEKTYEHSK